MVISISNSLSKYIHWVLFQQLEDATDFLDIYNGGSDNSEMVAKLTGQINDTKVSISGNQIFVVFQTNIEIVRKGYHALIMEGKYFDHNKLLEIGKSSLNALVYIL